MSEYEINKSKFQSTVSKSIIQNRTKKIEERKRMLQNDLKKAVDILTHHYSVRRIILFGSLAAGRISVSSDIDLIVEGLGDRFLKALGHCMRECKTNVDIKPLEDLIPRFKHAVLEKGEIIYESGK
ncbi:MAG: nucleotidyltransferase family protein [Candidatus Scalindua sp.]